MNNDLISREDLKKALKSNCKPELCPDYNTAWCKACCRTNDFEDLIDEAPTVEAKDIKPQGEWIDCSEDYGYAECPFCEHLTTCGDNIDELHYCWNCGAKLERTMKNERGEEV